MMMARRMEAVAALLAVLLAAGCMGATKHKGGLTEQNADKLAVSAKELRLHVRLQVGPLSSLVEEAADSIRADSADQGVRRAALLWKIEAIPEMQAAIFQPDPVAAWTDSWAMSVQMQDYFTSGPGATALGDRSGRAAAACRRLEEEIEGLGKVVAVSPEILAKTRSRVHEFASAHPITGPIGSRASTVSVLASALASEEVGALAAVGGLAESLSDYGMRIDLFNIWLPKQARWQAELLAGDMAMREDVGSLLGSLATISSAADGASRTVQQVPGLVTSEREAVLEAVRSERIAVLKAVDADLRLALDRLTEERKALLDALSAERVAAMEALSRERVAAMKEIDEAGARAVGVAAAKADDLVERVASRLERDVLVIVGALILTALSVALILRRRTRDHAARVAPPSDLRVP